MAYRAYRPANEAINTRLLTEIFLLIGLPYEAPVNDEPVSFSPVPQSGMLDPVLFA